MTWRERYMRLAGLWKVRRHERDLAEELEFHLAMKQRNYRERQGMNAQQAAERAKRDFGGFEKWKEVCRDVARWRWLEEFAGDLVLAVRILRKSPVFTAVALTTLTLAIGANTAIFSLMNTLVLKALPVPSADRLMMLRQLPAEPSQGFWFNYPLYKQVEQHAKPLMKVFAFTGRDLAIRSDQGMETVAGQLVGGQYFAALAVKPEMGRWITPNDDRPGAPEGAVAVVSHRYWQRWMGADPHALGRRLTFNKAAFTVVGVMPARFRGMNTDERPDVFIPFELEPMVDAPFNFIGTGFGNWWFKVGAARQDAVSVQQVDAFLKTRSHGFFETAAAGVSFRFNGHNLSDLYLGAEPGVNGFSYLRLRFQKPLVVLMGLVVMVLLIACLNLATLLMARASSRAREFSTRFALGASRGRLLRQLLTETLVLALFGTALGLVTAPALAGFIGTMLVPRHDPNAMPLEVTPDLNVFLFTAAVAIFATVLTGTLPAFRSTRVGLNGSMREASVTLRGGDRRHPWPRLLLSLEVALALMLVTGATLLGYSLVKLHQIPLGFDPQGLVYLPLDMVRQPQKGPALMAVYRNILSDVERLPGVTSDSLMAVAPIDNNLMAASVKLPGGPEKQVMRNTVGPGYFAAMRTRLLQGREFLWTDTAEAGRKAILNESAVRMLFPKGRALGRQTSLGEVIGIAADAKYTTIQDAPPPTLYTAAPQDVIFFNLLVRTAGSSDALVPAIQKIVRRVVPDIPTPVALSLDQTIAESLTSERMMAMLALFFGGLGLLMTGVGLYGTLAYATERRTGEIGIRLALGAQPSNVIRMVCGENGAIALAGCGLGIAGSALASKTIAGFLYGVSARDPLVFAAAAIMLLCVAAAASLIPALKAARIDPIAAIRYE